MGDLLRILILAPFAYVAALVAAALTLAFASQTGTSTHGIVRLSIHALTTMGFATFVPCIIAFFVAEVLRIRSVFAYVLFGGALGFVIHRMMPLTPPAALLQDRAVAFAAAGFIGGFVYWAIAGRLAGLGRAT